MANQPIVPPLRRAAALAGIALLIFLATGLVWRVWRHQQSAPAASETGTTVTVVAPEAP